MTAQYVERYGISIQVFLNGYSYKITDSDGKTVSYKGEGTVEELYSSRELSFPFTEYSLSFRTNECVLVPNAILKETLRRENAAEGKNEKPWEQERILRGILSEYVPIDDNRKTECIEVPAFDASIIYAIPDNPVLKAVSGALARECRPLPEIYLILEELHALKCHNRVIASYRDSLLSLAIAEEDRLLLCNSFQAADFTTALYFIFSALKQYSLNPEVTTINFMTPLDDEKQMLLYRYFSGVEAIR